MGLVAIATAGQPPSPALPEGPGKDLVEAVCTACHTLERVVAKRATKAEWQDKVLEMLQEDPDITQQERDQIVEYLAKNFPPQTGEKGTR
jgi:tellurite resistance protein